MASPNDDLNRLRAEIMARHRAAGRKVSRMRSRGVELSGTNFDPRRDASRIKKYNRAQLQAYGKQLNSFTSRSNQYVPGDSGAPIPARKWQEYKRLENEYNRRGQRHFENVAETFIAQRGVTIRQRELNINRAARASGESVRRPYEAIDRKPSRIPDAQALDTLIKDMRKKLSRKYLPEQTKSARGQLMDMLKEIGNLEHMEMASKLSDAQLDTLWNYTSFTTEVSRDYEIMKARAKGERDRARDRTHENDQKNIGELLSWAQLLPKKRK